jgi:hypothetical protein
MKSKLSAEQKTHNRALSSKRVSIEHVFAQLKKFKILGSFRLCLQKFQEKSFILGLILLQVFII